MTSAAVAAVASIVALPSLIPSLPQAVTNGASLLGTLQAPNLSTIGVGGVATWGGNTVDNTNPYTTDFNSGRGGPTYNFNIARGVIAPDGVNRSALLINGAFPAPTIEANWGDIITVNVCNKITGPEEGTALHWHGILQKTSPWYDGVPAVDQCPIAPGQCMTYSFLADVYGTSWYHSHYSAQYNAGLAGPMIIHGPSQAAYDIDVGPIMLSDWYHEPYEQIVREVMASPASPLPPFSDSNLINGKMSFNCAQLKDKTQQCTSNAGLSKFKFQSGKKHRLRLINSGSEGIQRFTIDGLNMTVIANDFVPVKPYVTKMVTLGVGQRTDVIVTATGPPTSAIWMRSDLSPTCDAANHPYALAAIYYEKADNTAVPKTSPTAYDDSKCGNDDLALTTPYYNFQATGPAAVTQELVITAHTNTSGNFLFYVNNQTFRANYNHPILPLANSGNFSYPAEWNVYNFGTNASVRLVVYNDFIASHPMHLHGHNFNVLAEGYGKWDGKTIAHASNTQRRDTQLVQGAKPDGTPAYIVLQYNTDNPGTWPFHCHIAWHVSGGLYINTIEQTALLQKRVLPPVVNNVCNAWNAYTSKNVVDQIDSGEKRMFARDWMAMRERTG